MTKQEIFNTVAKHLLTQRKKSASAWGSCYYRSCNGLKCAIGVLIKDEFYSPTIEGLGVRDSPVITALKESGIASEDVRRLLPLLSDLQNLHDISLVAEWKEGLQEIARKNLVKMPEMENNGGR